MKQQSYPGTFIVVEGADGAGTTTQSKKLAEELEAEWTSEPTSGRVGEKVDEMISSGEYSAEAIALAFAADRMTHLEEKIIPLLKEGETVVSDRYYHSSLVYQPVLGAESGWVDSLNRYALKPDLTLVLDVSADTAMDRIGERGSDDNIFEELSFQEKVVVDYRRLPDRLGENVEVVDATRSKEEVFSEIKQLVDRNC